MLINCSECNAQISDKAATCPHCGAPTLSVEIKNKAASTEQEQRSKKTSPATWLILVIVVVAGLVFYNKSAHDANLPLMPVAVHTRSAMTGPGLVLRVENTSTRHLTFLVHLKNPTTNQEKDFRLDSDPSGSVELGYKEGWTLASGDAISIKNNDYQSWFGSAP